jgi:hypothetical protein
MCSLSTNGIFDISGSVERWLYLYARKATGGPTGVWKETFKSLIAALR